MGQVNSEPEIIQSNKYSLVIAKVYKIGLILLTNIEHLFGWIIKSTLFIKNSYIKTILYSSASNTKILYLKCTPPFNCGAYSSVWY